MFPGLHCVVFMVFAEVDFYLCFYSTSQRIDSDKLPSLQWERLSFSFLNELQHNSNSKSLQIFFIIHIIHVLLEIAAPHIRDEITYPSPT